MLVRILLLAGGICLLVYLLRRSQRSVSSPAETHEDAMVPCGHCGVHVPESEAVYRDGVPYCSASHRDADR